MEAGGKMTPPGTTGSTLQLKIAEPLTPDQQARVDAFRAFTDDKQKRWEQLTPDEQRTEVDAWERAMQTVNEERRGNHRDYSNLC